ncbi:putative bola-like protein [Tribonema minus]|uniref:Putative bola-like protein n=1 Tax=Tribonema minus TaxID=303371 RepID=A0A836CC52_9STRA|nr:putative bola-like protein [Tribonema minus]
MQAAIEAKLTSALAPTHLEVTCSDGNKWAVTVISEAFQGKPLLARHRLVNTALAEELEDIHALSLKTKTPAEWEKS